MPSSVRKQSTVVSNCAPREARAAPAIPIWKKYSSTKSMDRLKKNPRTMMVMASTCRFSFLNMGVSPQDKTWMMPPAIMILPYSCAAPSRSPEAPINCNNGVRNSRKHRLITAPAARSARIVLARTRSDSFHFCCPCLILIKEAPPAPIPVPVAVMTAITGHATLMAARAVSPTILLTNRPSTTEYAL